ncbi:DUF5662 family protein [Adlercreutzia sp. ZJ138]|uniref:DUF5662 family protein n=1 Tax=Adlercreutzia sp. ZJ138 TaxID=2709405 RepID=UPI0013EBFEBB|nr:DUF5662 family protein [Adlercreutzia sp. ZJ138]
MHQIPEIHETSGRWSWRNAWRHFSTITRHRTLVMRHCFKAGLYWQGLTHDLSKYSPTEFKIGVRYYQGDKSPNAAERHDKGYSEAWMHHKGRNKHHFEYWIDLPCERGAALEGKRMPPRYLVEMVCDRIAASKVYQGDAYTDRASLDYFTMEKTSAAFLMHPETKRELEFLLTMVANEGEDAAFRYMKHHVLGK